MPSHSVLVERYGPWAVITGASSGIGAEFSRQLAAAGMNVVLVARRVDRLEALADEIKQKYSTDTRVLPADLATPDGFQKVLTDTHDLDVGLLINNAGMGSKGAFLGGDNEYNQRLIAVNVTSVMSLAHGFGLRLSRRQRSAMLFVSSMMSDPAPYFAPYCSSKAFVTNLALTLRAELASDGVDVSVLEPGFVKSEMSADAIDALDMTKVKASVMETDVCVRLALDGLAARHSRIVPGFSNRFMRFMTGLVPEGMRVNMIRSVMASAMKPDLLKYKA